MTVEIILFKEIMLFPELFLGISLVYLILYGIFISLRSNFPIIQNAFSYLGILVLLMTFFLLINDNLNIKELSIFNNTIVNDFLGLFSKTLICVLFIFCLLFIQRYLIDQRINNFEYVLLIIFSLLGLLLLCSSNDLITAYLSIELQSLSFYVLAASRKNSTFSVDAGLKYFILGSFSSSLFLFGSSLLYGISGTINFDDFKDLFFWIFPGVIASLSNVEDYYANQDKEVLLYSILQKLAMCQDKCLSTYDVLMIKNDMLDFDSVKDNPELVTLYGFIAKSMFRTVYLYLIKHTDDVYSSDTTLEHYISDFYTVSDELRCKIWNLMSGMRLYDNGELDFSNSNIKTKRELFACWSFLNIMDKLPACFYLYDYQDNNISASYNFFSNINLLQFSLVFILISLLFKLAIAPFHLWSPDVYEGSPSSSTFLFSVVPKIAIFVLLIRIFYYSFYGFIENWRYFVVFVTILSVLVGSFGGIEQRKLKSLLAYSSISHMGYSFIAFCSGTFEGIQMLFSYLCIYVFSGLTIWAIFFLTRLKNNYFNKYNKELTDFVLLSKSNKLLAFYFSIVLFSIGGFPPMVGFLVKMGVFLTAIESSMYFISLVSILSSIVATFYYLRIIKILYFEKVLVGKLYYPITTKYSSLIVLLSFLFLFLFINPTFLFLVTYKLSLLTIF